MEDDRPLIAQYLEPRRRQKSPQRIAEEESRKRAKARGGKMDQWNDFWKPTLLSVLAIAAFFLAAGLANVILTGRS